MVQRVKKNSEFAFPADLAGLVRCRLRESHCRSPRESVLRDLLEIAFFASLRTEEAESIRCALTYISNKNPDASPPPRIVADRWSVTRFAESAELNVKNLVKIAKSVDPNAGSLAVYPDAEGELKIWGIIDQRVGRGAFLRAESDEGAEPPGLLEFVITGIGTIEVYRGYTLIAALRQGHLASGFQDVLNVGPVSDAFRGAVSRRAEKIREEVGEEIYSIRQHWGESIEGYWIRALTRILLGIQGYGHGGAVLITPDDDNGGIRLKYEVSYARLRDALKRVALHTIERVHAEDLIDEHYLERNADDIPTILHLDEVVHRAEEEDTSDEITGCVQLIASLSRVDGAILMNPDLSVRGYGGIITIQEEPPSVWLASEPSGRRQTSARIRAAHFGTRHQSMMRVCYARPGSVGFVVSQDGDVRAMTRVGDRIVLWEDVKLRVI